jgi:integrase
MPKPKQIDLAAALAAAPATLIRQMTLGELVAAYFARNPLAEGQDRLRKWLSALGGIDAWDLPSETLERAAEAYLEAGYQPSSVNRDLSTLGSVYRWARRKRITPKGFTSPTIAIRRYPESIRRIEISAKELERLRDGAVASRSKGFGAFINALIDSGARKSEVLERTWRDLDAEAGTLTAMTTKTGVPRVLFLQPRTLTLLRRLGGANPPDDAVIFRGRFPDQPKDFRKAWQTLSVEIGRPELHLNDLRHARAASLLRAGVTSGVAAQVLGHSPQILHRRYGHLELGALRAAIEQSWAAA